MSVEQLAAEVTATLKDNVIESRIYLNELTIEVSAEEIHAVCLRLRDDLQFAMLIDLCAVDYLHYGVAEWKTESTTETGYSRAVDPSLTDNVMTWQKPRFAVVYHLLSLEKNQRIRVKVFLAEDNLVIDSVLDIWASANWFEREAFDLFGVMFKGHPDLRRILTDYGFIGHPFRKDFPLIGHVEMRYDATLQRCVYEPVSIQPRTLVPKTIRNDNRYSPKDEGSQT